MTAYMLPDYTLDGRPTRIVETDFRDWWILQQLFAYPPFNEFFDTDKLTDYYNDFVDGAIYQLEINIKDDLWAPVGLLSWHPQVPIEKLAPFFKSSTTPAYISDSVTYRAYRCKHVQVKLMEFAFAKMKERGFTEVYLRTSPRSKMCKLVKHFDFVKAKHVHQRVTSHRIDGKDKTDCRIFFIKQL